MQVDLRSFVDVGRRSAKTASGFYFEPRYLRQVINALQKASQEIEGWRLDDDFV